MDFIYYFLFFIIYGFIGWVYESTLCSITQKKFVNRGFLSGPICPIYGFGAIAAILALYQKTDNIFIIFLSSMAIMSLIEYLTSWLMEKIFHMRWWDYSDRPFNISGRIYLLGSLVFGALSTLLVTIVHPATLVFINFLPPALIVAPAAAFFIWIFIDTFFTIKSLIKLNQVLAEIQSAFNRFVAEYIKRSESLMDSVMSKFEESKVYDERVKKIIVDVSRRRIRHLIEAFPKSKSSIYNDAWSAAKNKLENSTPKPKINKAHKTKSKK